MLVGGSIPTTGSFVRDVFDERTLSSAFRCMAAYDSVVLAVSGGPDSIALMHLAKKWMRANGHGPQTTVATIDHGLRAESADEALFVAAQASALGLPHVTLAWTGEKPRSGIQAAARDARYRLLADYCGLRGVQAVVTAHTEDDQAETFLMRLRRGSGLDGLSAMTIAAEWNGTPILRPLLGFSKRRLLAYLRQHGLPYVDDPSNRNSAFERVRLRQATKALAAAGITRLSLSRASSRLDRSRRALDSIAEAFLQKYFRVSPLGQGAVDREAFLNLPEDLRLRAVSRILPMVSGRSNPPRMARVERLLPKLALAHYRTTLGGCILAADSRALNVYREPGRLTAAIESPEAKGSFLWDGRFQLRFSGQTDSQSRIAPLGSRGWTIALRHRAEKAAAIAPQINRLAALTTPALWRGDALLCAPLLDFHADGCDGDALLEATLSPPLSRFLNPI